VAQEFQLAWADFCPASNSESRWASLTGIRPEQFARLIDLDMESLVHNTEKLRDVLKLGHTLTIQVDPDHSLFFEIDPQQCIADTGLIRNPGDSSCLPGGRVLLRPLPGSSSGDLLVNGSLSEVGLLQSPARFLIRKGWLNKIYSRDNVQAFRSALRRNRTNRRTLVRVGIGLNPRTKLTGNAILDQRARGVVHLAFGDERDYQLHLLNPGLPLVTLKKASLQIDNKWIMRRGKFLI
jgi:leucyl aminopeptidase (aminopeptidase T)